MNALALYPIDSSQFHYWQLLTYAIPHAGLLHLVANLFLLWMFGKHVKGALWIAGIATVAGAYAQLPFMDVPLIGASPAALAMVMAYAQQKPTARCWMLVPMTAEMLGFVLLTFNLLCALTLDAGVGWWSHVGGMCAGYLVAKVRR